jgi:glycosyltransferase involved in cell wall biosynthesis
VDVLLLPSDTEGTPNCIVEAMAHGLPVIATSVGGIPDVVTPDVGLLVPPGDAGALAAAMAFLAEDGPRRARMATAAAERYQRLFSPEAVIPVLLETYRRVVDPSAQPAAARYEWAEGGDGG